MIWKIFLVYLQVGLFSIGGGHAAIPVVQSLVVDKYAWMTIEEFLDVVTISEMTPGPFALNSATFIGMRMGGFWGGLAASFGFMVPGLIIVLIIAYVYNKYSKVTAVSGVLTGVRPATTGLIASTAISLFMTAVFGTSIFGEIEGVAWLSVITSAVCFIVIRIWKKNNPVWVILIGGVVGGILYTIF